LVSQFGSLIANSADSKEEEHEELMSADGSCVRIMTIHASKGLQAPIVIIPEVQQFDLKKKILNGFCSENGERVLNLNGDELKNQIEKAELEAETRRLIYVAVTRAEYRCEIFEEQVPSIIERKTAPIRCGMICSAFLLCRSVKAVMDYLKIITFVRRWI
jgi:exodeoxyribonuclease V beta subunit